MDCYSNCPFRVNETSNPHHCECVACQNRCNDYFVFASNKTLTDQEISELKRNYWRTYGHLPNNHGDNPGNYSGGQDYSKYDSAP